MKNKKTTGSCLCGEVKFEYTGPCKAFLCCHCSRCQKSTGSAHASNLIIEPDSFQWTQGIISISRYELPEAKQFARTFCTKCGTPLPWLNKTGTAIIIPAGSLDEDPGERPMHNIFYAEKAAWYNDIHELEKHDAYPE